MDRDRLKRYLENGLSLEQIGALVDRHPSTVSYWLKRYGLVPNGRARHAPRGGLSREALAPLVAQGSTLQEIADRLEHVRDREQWARPLSPVPHGAGRQVAPAG